MADYDSTIAYGLANFSNQAYEDEATLKIALAGAEFFQFFHGTGVLVDTQAFMVKVGEAAILAFRGTRGWEDMATGSRFVVRRWLSLLPPRRAHGGFVAAFHAIRPELSDAIRSLNPPRLFVSGHSLGGALATLAALDIAVEHPGVEVTMYNFGSPRVGDWGFCGLYESKVDDSFRVVVPGDVVSHAPAGGWWPFGYRHVRREHRLDDREVLDSHTPHSLAHSYLPQLREESGGVSYFE